jgi:hypothetical protein
MFTCFICSGAINRMTSSIPEDSIARQLGEVVDPDKEWLCVVRCSCSVTWFGCSLCQWRSPVNGVEYGSSSQHFAITIQVKNHSESAAHLAIMAPPVVIQNDSPEEDGGHAPMGDEVTSEDDDLMNHHNMSSIIEEPAPRGTIIQSGYDHDLFGPPVDLWQGSFGGERSLQDLKSYLKGVCIVNDGALEAALVSYYRQNTMIN